MNEQLRTIGELEQTLLSRKNTDRAGLPGLEKGSKEVIVASATIIRTIMETFGMPCVLVSDRELREGILIDWRRGHDVCDELVGTKSEHV